MTAFPKTPAQQERFGVRYDYDGEITGEDGTTYHKQPNAGKTPTSIKRWKEKEGGTHAVMANVFVKKHGTKADVKDALVEAHKRASAGGRYWLSPMEA